MLKENTKNRGTDFSASAHGLGSLFSSAELSWSRRPPGDGHTDAFCEAEKTSEIFDFIDGPELHQVQGKRRKHRAAMSSNAIA
jgi:hypothetical protein